MTRSLLPTDYLHTRVLGFSVTRSMWDAFYAAIPNPAAWELLWYSGGSVDIWADPNSHAWTARTADNSGFLVPSDPGGQGGLINGISHAQDPTVGTSAIDRVILNVSGLAAGAADPVLQGGYNGGVRPDLSITGSTTGFPPSGYNTTVSVWKAYIDAAVANVRAKYPNARMILLQPNIAGPFGSELCSAGGDSNAQPSNIIRCCQTSPILRSAIAAATHADVRPGFMPFASACADFSDWAGHLNTTPRTTHGQAMAAYYAAHL